MCLLTFSPIEAPARGALALWKESTTSSEARSFLAAHTVSRDAWLQAGGSQASPGERGGTTLCDARFGGWNAPRPSEVDSDRNSSPQPSAQQYLNARPL
mgnify:FL=1